MHCVPYVRCIFNVYLLKQNKELSDILFLLTTVNGFLDRAFMGTSWHVVINESLLLSWHGASLGFSSPTSACCEILSVLLPLKSSLVPHAVSYRIIFLNQSSCLCCFTSHFLWDKKAIFIFPFSAVPDNSLLSLCAAQNKVMNKIKEIQNLSPTHTQKGKHKSFLNNSIISLCISSLDATIASLQEGTKEHS